MTSGGRDVIKYIRSVVWSSTIEERRGGRLNYGRREDNLRWEEG